MFCISSYCPTSRTRPIMLGIEKSQPLNEFFSGYECWRRGRYESPYGSHLSPVSPPGVVTMPKLCLIVFSQRCNLDNSTQHLVRLVSLRRQIFRNELENWKGGEKAWQYPKPSASAGSATLALEGMAHHIKIYIIKPFPFFILSSMNCDVIRLLNPGNRWKRADPFKHICGKHFHVAFNILNVKIIYIFGQEPRRQRYFLKVWLDPFKQNLYISTYNLAWEWYYKVHINRSLFDNNREYI
jgi:hypothetical protein